MSGSPPQQRLEGLTVTDVAFQGLFISGNTEQYIMRNSINTTAAA